MAPEVLQDKAYGVQADIFSTAIILAEMLIRKYPYSREVYEASMRTFDKMIIHGERPVVPEHAKHLPGRCNHENNSLRFVFSLQLVTASFLSIIDCMHHMCLLPKTYALFLPAPLLPALPGLTELIDGMWASDPLKRPNGDEVLAALRSVEEKRMQTATEVLEDLPADVVKVLRGEWCFLSCVVVRVLLFVCIRHVDGDGGIERIASRRCESAER
jgi:serine/threonine protein kinase